MRNKNYKEFLILYKQIGNKISFGKKFIERLIDGHYSESTYSAVNNMIKFFVKIDAENNNSFDCDFSVRNNRNYYLGIGFKNENKFVYFKYHRKAFKVSHWDSFYHNVFVAPKSLTDDILGNDFLWIKEYF
jgi:hypothetical protein